MRKLFFISLAIITLSLNAVAQNQRLTDVKMFKAFNSFKNLHNEGRFNAQAKNLEINLSQKIQQKAAAQGASNQLLDSVYQFNWDTQNSTWSSSINNKTIISYDAKNREISNLSLELNNNILVNNFRTVTVYDVNDNYTITDQIWRNGIWENSYKSIITNSLSGDNMVMDEVNQDWDGAQWVNIDKTKYIGDFKDKNFPTFISIATQGWSGDTWVHTNQFIDISYHAGFQSDLLNFWTYTMQYWVNNAWLTVQSRTYDALNKIAVETVKQPTDLEGTNYVNAMKLTTTYDANINPINSIVELWDNNAWVENTKEIYTIDANNNNTGTLVQNWKANWVDSLKYTKSFDANNNMTSYLVEELDKKKWVKSQQQNTYYDANSFEISNTIKYWNYNGSEIVFGDSTVNYYRTVPTSVKSLKMEDANINVYPNPVKDFLQISGIDNIKTVLITDLNGKLMLNKNLPPVNDKIYIGNFINGLYIVKIISVNATFQQKILKQ